MRTWAFVFSFIVIAAAVPRAASAQTGSVSGRITDSETSQPLTGASITLLQKNGTAQKQPVRYGTVSNPDGSYFFAGVPAGEYRMQISHIGYRTSRRTAEVKSGGDAVVDAALLSDPLGLDEVVVTGAASRTEKNRSEVAVSRLYASDWLETNTYRDMGQMLAAKIPGVRISPTSGNAAGDFAFSIRSGAGLYGNSRPAIFVDGTRIADEQVGEFVGGADPTVESAGGRSMVRGRDFLTLQNPRVFTATITIGL